MRDLKLVCMSVAALQPRERNPRTHSKKQIQQIADSIRQFGFTNPVLIDDQNGVIAGHGRVAAAKLLGIETVPVIRLSDMSEAEIRAYVIADNKLAENADWDRDLLALELQGLSELKFDFDLTITGFEAGEIDVLIGSLDVSTDEEDRVPEIDDKPPVSRLGDLWILGRHRLFCGDATKPETFARLMARKSAQMVFTDPPYNVPIEGHVCGLGQVKHAEFAMASGEMSEAEFVAFLNRVLSNLARHSADGSMHFVCMDWRHAYELLTAGRSVYAELKNICVWNKTNGGMGSLYRSKHELVFVFKHGDGPHINNVELGTHGRYRTNVWDYAGINALGADRGEALAMHPTVKPVALVADALLDCSKRGSIVLDCFSGSGTTLLATERTGRCGYGMEIDPKYVDVTIERYRQLTGEGAVHESGASFVELKEQRQSERELEKEESDVG